MTDWLLVALGLWGLGLAAIGVLVITSLERQEKHGRDSYAENLRKRASP